MRAPLACAALAMLCACSGAMVAGVMPGEVVTIDGNTFTVQVRDSGVTVQNFETGRTNPAVLQTRAGQAAETVTGCPIDTLIKDGISNTYYITVSCPE